MKEQKEMEYGAVTVIIPNYNGIDYLDACIHSLLKQTLLPRIIVVDNGSKDKSIPFLKEKYKEGQILPDGRILHFKLIELGQNTGFSNAVNVGIRAADTEYVFLLNNDTIADEHATEQLMHTLRIHPKAFSAGAKMLSMQEKDRIDDCGDYTVRLAGHLHRGKTGTAPAITREHMLLLPVPEQQCIAENILMKSAILMKYIFVIWKIPISDIGRVSADTEIYMNRMLLSITPGVQAAVRGIMNSRFASPQATISIFYIKILLFCR